MCEDCQWFEALDQQREEITDWVLEQRAKLDSMMDDLDPIGPTPNANLTRGYAAGYRAALNAMMAEHGRRDFADHPNHLSTV